MSLSSMLLSTGPVRLVQLPPTVLLAMFVPPVAAVRFVAASATGAAVRSTLASPRLRRCVLRVTLARRDIQTRDMRAVVIT
jgi:hypothetical protein